MLARRACSLLRRAPMSTGMRRSDIALVAAVAFVFAPALLAMARVWTALDYYSHGFLVPLVAWWMFAVKRRRLGAPGRDPRGLAAIAGAALLLGLGFATGSPSWMGLAWVGAVCGLVLRFWGPAGLRLQAFPLAFLLFMVPLPAALLNPLIVRLQLWASAAGVAALQQLGYAVLREGNVMHLPGGERLFVDEACSGITSVVTLLPLGAVLAWLGEKSGLRRALIVLAVVPIAMLGNWLRVVLTVAGAERFGADRVLAGPLHESAGLLTFLFACALLIGLRVLLRAAPRRAAAGA
jgi:exosortase